ncbi:MAG: glutamate-5-semialdehyde dehydrogenase [Gudongella sp.]|nr:glutamate-5-semialdehyde dehydrogenase [Gudongella sp.]
MEGLKEIGKILKESSKQLNIASSEEKNVALLDVSKAIRNNMDKILLANSKDIKLARENNMKEGLVDRLMLDESRVESIIDGIQTVIKLDDPIWKSDKVWTLKNGLTISKMSVPLGVIGIIYESRPNVTVDAFALALKSGNAILLRGSSTAINSNRALVAAIKEGLTNSSIPTGAVEFIDDTNRALVDEMLKSNEFLDLIIPRGGGDLIKYVVKNATVPTLETGEGNCHLFIDKTANLEDGLKILINAKTQRVGVCNACETLLVHKDVAEEFLPMVEKAIKDRVELRADAESKAYIEAKLATEEDYETEFLDYILAIKIVDSIDEAIDHVNKYGTKHSEAIITENLKNATKFQREVDASTVYVNASTRFTDGSEFGFGAEMGISTQKTHARGPVGLEQLVTHKYLVMGNGQTRK